MVSSWIIYSFLILGTGILGERQLERRQAISSCSEDNDDSFVCTNGLCIEWSLVCDGHKDCSDGSDETKKLCARYEYGTNMNTDCGKKVVENKMINNSPWLVYLRAMDIIALGSIIAPNAVVAMIENVERFNLKYKQNSITVRDEFPYKVEFPSIKRFRRPYYIYPKMIYFVEDYKKGSDTHAVNLAVIVLADIISFSFAVSPICIDWYSKIYTYSGRNNSATFEGIYTQKRPYNSMVGTTYFNENQIHIDNFSCIHLYDTYNLADLVTYENVCIRIITDKIIDEAFTYQSLNILHSNSFFLTGLKSYWSTINNKTALGFIDVKYYVPWIRGILNKHGTVNSCVLPIVEGVVYSHEGSHEILSPGTLINHHRTVVENCEVGYHKAYTNGSRFCRENGKWLSNSEKLCFKMCPPLLSNSLDIKCSYNGKNSNCSNLSIPNTTATLSCKPTYSAPNGLQDTTLEINCQSNGIWDKQQYACKPTNVCVLPTAEGILYTYEDSNEILSHGTLINHNLTVNENCEVGYHKAYPNSFRVCQRNGKWKTISENLCLKMCPPLLSDSLDIKCFLNGKDANCSSPSIPGTIAIPSCKTTHKLPNGQEETPLNINCQSNGIWDNHLYECEPYCGKNYSNTKLLIANGQNASFGTAPWNVAIYRLNEKSHTFICGGSIIGPNLVISAAHCFWNTTITSNTIFVNDSFYKIAVGKYARDFTVIDNIFTKIMDVEMVYLKDCFNGYTGRYAEDIAIILLKNRIDFNDGVGPACIDWKGKFNVANGDIGKIVGWGETEEYFKSPILLEASLPYFNNSFCRKMFNTEFVSFVTPDKFCAGSTSVSGQRVGGGDSGAGLCFVHSDLYYLTGVVSSKDPETNYSIAAFTNIQSHIDWISELYIKHK